MWFGGGYVLIAYFDGELVQRLGWLSKPELLDAYAVRQITPGPLLSAVTFIGYKICGFYGALFATLGIILPSFIFVIISNPFIAKLRQSTLKAAFLDAVNISTVSLILAAAIKLEIDILIDWKGRIIAL